VDNIAESKMIARGAWMRHVILEKVREIEDQSQQHQRVV
jgi:hypothetical protein